MTQHHDLDTPEPGKPRWHEPLNSNFETIDELLQCIDDDGTTYSPSAIETEEITLDGTTRTSWPSGNGGDGVLYTTDTGTAGEEIIVAETAADIQDAIDTLDGSETGYDENDRASRPGGGVVQLKRKEYTPESTIEMRSGVRIVGCQQDKLLGRDNHQWQFSVLSGRELDVGEPIVEYPGNPDGEQQHAGLHDLVISGAGEDVHGIKINQGFGATYHSNLVITRCHGSGFWTRGCLDTWVSEVSCKANGSLASNNDLGFDAPSVRIESEDDDVGQPTNDTQIRWTGGRISSQGPVPALEASSSLQRFHDCSIKMGSTAEDSAPPTTTPVIDFRQGGLLELMRCTIDAYRDANTIGILRGNNQVRLGDSLVEKCGTGLAGEGNGQNMIANTKFRDFQNYAIEFGQRGALMSNVQIRGSRGDGILVDGANLKLPWSNLVIANNDGYAIRITGVKGGQPGDVPLVDNLHAVGNGKGETNAPELLVVDGKWRTPYTYDHQGSGSVELSEKPADPLDVRIDPGGGATLEGFEGPTRDGRVVVAEHAGDGTLTLAHADGSAGNPLYNASGDDETLTDSGQVVAYRYDGQNSVWREMWANAV